MPARAAHGDDNLTDLNRSFDEVAVASDGRTGTSDFHCEGPPHG
ncbi:hypothetical protein ACFVT2_27330 [Streptomyces sp. NPDC058000]